MTTQTSPSAPAAEQSADRVATPVESLPRAETRTLASSEVWVYGSVARGEHTPFSDLDVLVVGDHPVPHHRLDALVDRLPQRHHLAARQYTWTQLEQMAAYGSLFLLHIKLEGRPLRTNIAPPPEEVLVPTVSSDEVEDRRSVARMLARMPPYQLADRDIRGFQQAVEDAAWSIDDDGDPLFELGTLATIMRHCSILACYLLGTPAFATNVSVPVALEAVGLGHLSRDAVDLYDFRLAIARHQMPRVQPSRELATRWLQHASTFIHRVGGL